ncbi:MFS transporter [Lactiplantibacillus plantarum]|uniref:MFS transporter n=1 Tax=Lactiplantibacillus plantarum TaxID=1590 RepID=UPI000934E3CF|nr:MFS transporter [Lactiplantibacillus plantarum]BEI50104.1 major facilitator superfamily transporter [Lactiplantibacillus plantarum]
MENRQRQFGWLLALTSLGFFMAMMDSMIVTTASTAIKIDFDISEASLQWALNAYNVAIAATLLVGVALGDRFGRRRVYNLGILVFTLGSVFCALANRMPLLIVARVIAGIGASVMTPMSMAILTAAVPVAKRGKALGIWSGIGGLALIVGPALGGLIVAKLTWQWIFWINVPLGLIVIGLSRFYLPESTGVATSINLMDAGLSMLAMTAIIWALAASSTSINGIGPFVGLIIGLVAGTWFIKRQQHVVAPLMPLTLFKKRIFTMGNMATFLLYAAMYGVVFFLPQFLQVVQHDNAWEAGLSLLPWTGTLVLVAPFAGKAVDLYGEAIVAVIGLLSQTFGYFMLGYLVANHAAYVMMIAPLAIAGMGLSMAGPALQHAVLGGVSPAVIGKVAGIYNVFRLLGGAAGTAIAVVVFTVGSRVPAMNAIGFQTVMFSTALISAIGAGCAWQIRNSKNL